MIDAAGLALAPGFVDTHSHADSGLEDEREAVAAVSQGITTVVVGQDGGSRFPLADWYAELERRPAAVNVASYSGHNTLRSIVLGEDFARPATAAEVERMAALLQRDLDAGALGLATGLEYDPGIYSTTDEVVALAKVAAAAGGRYISHVRSEDRALWTAIDELIEIGRRASIPVQISHVKLAMTSLHGQAGRLVERLERARAEGIDVSADLYPYTYWLSTLEVFFPDRDFDDPEAARFAVTELARPEGILIPDFLPEPDYAGRSLASIARLRGEEPSITLSRLIALARAWRREHGAAAGRVESVMAFSMSEEDIETLLRWPHTNLATDGGLRGAHPRGFGAFPRFLGTYARERGVLSLEETVRRATSLAAEHAGLEGRGRLLPGWPADLVLFDPARIDGSATIDSPHRPADGIAGVWVNGVRVWDGSEATGAFPGRVLLRPPD